MACQKFSQSNGTCLRSGQMKNDVQKAISSVLPDGKIIMLDSKTDGLNLPLHVGGFERVEFVPEMGEEVVGTLNWILRGVPLSINQLVHIPGLGDFQMLEIYAPEDPYKMRKNDEEMSSGEVKQLAKADPTKQTSLQGENITDAMDANQTWPTEEEIEASKNEHKKKLIKRIPESMKNDGGSDEDDVEEDEEEEDYMTCASDSESKIGDKLDEEEDEEKYDEDQNKFVK